MAVSVGQIEQLIEKIAPRYWAEEWDNPGLLVGSSAQRVNRVLLSLEATKDVVEEAILKKVDLIVAHHPLIFKPLKNLRTDQGPALLPLTLFQNGIAFYAAHTNLDQSELSSSFTLARILGLEKTQFLEVTAFEKLYKIVVFVPEEQVEEVRKALAAEGVGAGLTSGENSENYIECFFQSPGEGMFRPLEGANPTLGKVGELTKVGEIKLEGLVDEKSLGRVIKTLHKVHPYEEPAYDLIPLKNPGKSRGYGAIGYLSESMPLGELWEKFLSDLNNSEKGCFPVQYNLSSVRLAGDRDKKVKKIAIANGSGSSLVSKAIYAGVDLYITGEIKYHELLDSLDAGLAVGELGHFFSEIPMLKSLFEYLRGDKTMAGVEFLFSESGKNPWL